MNESTKIHQIGIYFHGIPLIILTYDNNELEESDQNLITGFFSAIQGLSSELFHQFTSEFKGDNYIFVFSKEEIKHPEKKNYNDYIVGYVIVDNSTNLEKHEIENIKQRLRVVLSTFRKNYDGFDLCKTSKFKSFEKKINKIFTRSDCKSISKKYFQ